MVGPTATRFEQVHDRLKNLDNYEDLDLDLLVNKKKLRRALSRAPSIAALAETMEMPATALRSVIEIHGIPVKSPGGGRETGPEIHDHREPRVILAEIPPLYGPKRLRKMVIAAQGGTYCPKECALYFECWPAYTPNRRRPSTCRVAEHLRLIGVELTNG